MQLIIIHAVFFFATVICMNNEPDLHLFKPEVNITTTDKELFTDPKQISNETESNPEKSTRICIAKHPQESTVNVNGLTMNGSQIPIQTINEAPESTLQSPIKGSESQLDNTSLPNEEKNSVPALNDNGNQKDTKSNQTTDKGIPENNLPQIVTSATPKFHCSLMWPECINHDNATRDLPRELTRFTLDLYKALSSHDRKPNIVISPISIALGLSQLMLGSNGQTREDMLKVMYGFMNNPECVHDAIQNLTKSHLFLSANALFFNKDFSLKEEFTSQSERFYGNKGIKLQKDKKKSLNEINKWVSKNTNNLIQNLFKELPDFELMLINVIHYQGKWKNRFDLKRTKNEAFHLTPLSKIKVPMMNHPKYPLQSIRDTYLDAHVARLPLSDNCSLIIFLPLSQDRNALKNVEHLLTEEIVTLLMTQLEEKSPRATALSFPKLNLDSDFDLIETLRLLEYDVSKLPLSFFISEEEAQRKLRNVIFCHHYELAIKKGLYDLFEHPDFCALSDNRELAVSDVRHHAILEIKEDGVEAAAATSVTVGRSLSLFSVQRPFLYILANDIKKIPIVIGRVTDPRTN